MRMAKPSLIGPADRSPEIFKRHEEGNVSVGPQCVVSDEKDWPSIARAVSSKSMAVRRACVEAATHNPRMMSASFDTEVELTPAFDFMGWTLHNCFISNAMLVQC